MPELKCGSCQKPQSQCSIPLKRCAKCHSQYYCSRDCQKADWKAHKPSCRLGGPASATGSSSSSSNPGPCHIDKPFTALQNGTWLKQRPEKDVFTLLVDIYRMRVEDRYKFDGDVDEGSMYAGGTPESALKVFESFLTNATRLDNERPAAKKILPEWWNQEKLNQCLEVARTDEWSNIGYAVEKHDIQDHYKQNDMPMQMRIFSEQVDGTRVMGQSGMQMLQMRAMMEGGKTGMESSMLDISQPRRR